MAARGKTAGRWAGVSNGSTASSEARPTSITPIWFTTTTRSTPPGTPEQGYHLTVDLTDHAIAFLQDLRAVAPDKPFFLYYAPGAAHAPHQAPKEWIARYKGKFDQGWDKLREETLARQKAMGVVPPNTELPPRFAEVKAWDGYSARREAAVLAHHGSVRRRTSPTPTTRSAG